MKSLFVLLAFLRLVSPAPITIELDPDTPLSDIASVRERVYCEEYLPKCHKKCPEMIHGVWTPKDWFPGPLDPILHAVDIKTSHMSFCMMQLHRCTTECDFHWPIVSNREAVALAREFKKQKQDETLKDAVRDAEEYLRKFTGKEL